MHITRLCDDFHAPQNMKQDLSTHIIPLILALKKEGINQTIYTMKSEITELDNIKINKIPQERPFSFFRTGLSTYKLLKKSKEKTDIIHYQNPRFSSILLKKKELPPIVMTIHDSPKNVLKSINLKNPTNTKQTLYYYTLARWSSKKLDALICVSPGVREEIIKHWNIPEDKIHVATTAVDTNIFYAEKTKKDIDILFAGRLVEKKRPLDFIKTTKRLKKTIPNIKAVMIGASRKDPLYKEVTSKIKSNNLENNIKIIESVPQDKLRTYYNKSKILILPSTTESAPKVTLEAMSCKTPVITTKISGNKNITIEGKTGYLIPPKNIEELTKKTYELLQDKDLREKMGSYASKRIKKQFTWEATAKKHIEIYNSLL